MESKGSFRHLGRASTVAAASTALILAITATSPARAADDGQGTILGSLMQIVGLKDKPDTAPPKIDYRQRAPLVLPKTMTLPPPASSINASNPDWPKDPDVAAARREEELARAPAPTLETADGPMSFRAMQADRAPDGSASSDSYRNCEMYDTQCDPHQIWAQLKVKKGDPGAIPGGAPAMKPGVEPVRQYLTEPPSGYLAPTQVVKRTFEIPRNKEADDNSNVYWMEQSGHHVTQDDPGSD